MGMSTHVVGFKPPDEKWQKMKAIWDACEAGGTDVPVAVEKFFDGEEPDAAGVVLEYAALKKCGVVTEWSDDSRQGYEIHIDKMPPDVKIIRVFNSW